MNTHMQNSSLTYLLVVQVSEMLHLGITVLHIWPIWVNDHCNNKFYIYNWLHHPYTQQGCTEWTTVLSCCSLLLYSSLPLAKGNCIPVHIYCYCTTSCKWHTSYIKPILSMLCWYSFPDNYEILWYIRIINIKGWNLLYLLL